MVSFSLKMAPVTVEYIWVGGTGLDYRSKTKVVDQAPETPDDLPVWSYDGSSTGQATTKNSEVYIMPRALFRDPFTKDGYLVLCDTWVFPHKPLSGCPEDHGLGGNNTRVAAQVVFENPLVKEQKCWFGLEQEYMIRGAPQRYNHYCGTGHDNMFGRKISREHLNACIRAGVKICGANAEVTTGQWEYQIGPCEGIEAGDHLVVSRYILERVCENNGVQCTFNPKPLPDVNGSGCHCNFSTKDMRDPKLDFEYTATTGPFADTPLRGGMAKILEAIERLGAPGKPKEHMAVYGPENYRRLTGKHETAGYEDWSYGVGDRGASIRIPQLCMQRGYGYLEDRRPASNIDPYVVTAKLAQTVLL